MGQRCSRDQQFHDDSNSDMYTDDEEDNGEDNDNSNNNNRSVPAHSSRRSNMATIGGPFLTTGPASPAPAPAATAGGESSTSTHMSNEFRRKESTTDGVVGKRNDSRRASNYNDVHLQVSEQLMQFETQNQQQELNEYRPMGVVGLQNLGNTCFLNSSIQCLSATIPLTDYFLGYDYKSEVNKSNFLGTGGKLVTAYAQLLKEMWLSNKKVVKPNQFKKQLSKFAPQFTGTYQHDAQELLSFLLDGIHEDLNRVKEKPYVEDKDCDGTNDEVDAIEAWKNYLRRNKSLVVDLFQGQLRNTCRCNKCGHTNIRFEPFMYLSLPISDSCQTLQDCFDLFVSTDELKGENRWYCEKCKKHRDATKKIDLWITPPILIVHLKRFKYNDSGQVGSKNNANIRFPMEGWDLTSAVKSKGSVTSVYDLYAVSNHFGNLRSGHYTAYSLTRFDEQWIDFNDSHPRPISKETVIQQSSAAYVLFYNRSDKHDVTPQANSGPASARYPMVRRQSVTRPDLWPHTQVEDNKFRDFTRKSTSTRSLQSPGASPMPSSSRNVARVDPSLGPAPPILFPANEGRTTRSTAAAAAKERESAQKRSAWSGKKSSRSRR